MRTGARTGNQVRVRVPAKVNLGLRVGPPRADGFHELATVYQAVNLFDTVVATPAPEWGITLTGRTSAGVPTDDTNLALRAARLLAGEHDIPDAVHLRITKEIPVAGGMAGGSADAAGALLACNRLWELNLPVADLVPYAAQLGSDVPFLLTGGTALGTGRGEQVVPVLTRRSYHWVFALSDAGLSTPAVYAECDRLRADAHVAQPQRDTALLTALAAGDPHALADCLHNDLQPAALHLQPALERVLAAGMEYGALAGLVSGSGPTLAFLAKDAESAIDLAVALTASGEAADVRKATGPATTCAPEVGAS